MPKSGVNMSRRWSGSQRLTQMHREGPRYMGGGGLQRQIHPQGENVGNGVHEPEKHEGK